MTFYKTCTAGNEFVHIESGGRSTATELSRLARQICRPGCGPGADGVVFYQPQKQSVAFRVFNRDGSEAELSGNGMAGLAALLFSRAPGRGHVLLSTRAGPKRVVCLARQGEEFQVRTEIGRPNFHRNRFFPFLKQGRDRYRLKNYEFFPVSVGNPHCVVLSPRIWQHRQLLASGAMFQTSRLFPLHTNVEFVRFQSADECRVFFYERGVGPTLSSATGSAAVFAVLRRLGLVRDRLTIACGGQLIQLVVERGVIFVESRTRIVCSGEYFSETI